MQADKPTVDLNTRTTYLFAAAFGACFVTQGIIRATGNPVNLFATLAIGTVLIYVCARDFSRASSRTPVLPVVVFTLLLLTVSLASPLPLLVGPAAIIAAGGLAVAAEKRSTRLATLSALSGASSTLFTIGATANFNPFPQYLDVGAEIAIGVSLLMGAMWLVPNCSEKTAATQALQADDSP